MEAEGEQAMFPILRLLLLAVAAVLVVAVPWHRPHPDHLFFGELLPTRLQDEFELSVHSATLPGEFVVEPPTSAIMAQISQPPLRLNMAGQNSNEQHSGRVTAARN